MARKIEEIQSGAVATSNGRILDVRNFNTVCCQVTGITSATITWEGSIDGANWVAIRGVPLATGTAATTTTADGLFAIPTPGLCVFRARISTYATGTIYVTAQAIKESGWYL